MKQRKEKVEPAEEALNEPLEFPDYEIVEGKVWYPPDEFLVKAHDIMIKRYGGWTGFETGLKPYHKLIEEAKRAKGVYRKAAILLRGIATSRIFQDGHHRTAFIVTKTFLEVNDVKPMQKSDPEIIKFIKDIRQHNIDEIESWLKND